MIPLATTLPVGNLAGLGTAVGWAGTSMFFTAGGKRVGSLPVNIIRLTLGLGMLTIWGVVFRGELIPAATPHAWLWLAISGVVGMAICDLCLFESFLLIGPRVAMLILTLSPPVTALTGWLMLGEKMIWLHLIGMGLVLAGVGWVVFERKQDEDGNVHRHPILGVLLAVLAAIGQGVGLVLSKIGMVIVENGETIDQCPSFGAAQIRLMSGLAAMIVFYCFIGVWPKVIRSLRDRRAMIFTSLGAFVGPFMGVGLSMVALKECSSAGMASTLAMTAPVFVIPMAAIFLKERVSARAVIGALVAVGGVAMLMIE
jgi:drug/metabolite transporter (DMT)-like permease